MTISSLTLCVLMDFPIQIDTISMGLPIMYFKGSQIEFSKLECFSVPECCFNLANSADPDEMQHCAAFHQGLHCLPKNPFRDIWSLKG